MKELLELKEKIDSEIFDEVLITIKEITAEYGFLGIKIDKWNILACKMVNNLLEKNKSCENLKNYMINWAKKYIKGEYRARRGRIFNNLFIMLNKKELNVRAKVLEFTAIIKQNGLKFNASFYDFLKEHVPEFNKILKQLGILDYSFNKFKMYYLDNYDIYSKFLASGYSYGWTVKKVNEFVSKGFMDLNNLNDTVILLIKNYEIIETIHREFCKNIRVILLDEFILYLIFLEVNEVKKIISEYKEVFIVKGIYDISFFVRLNSLISKNDLDDLKKGFNEKIQSEIINLKDDKKTVYDYFPDIAGISKDEKRKKVNKILEQLSGTQRKNIDNYVNKKFARDSKEYKNTAAKLSKLKKLYIETLGLEISGLTEIKETIYDYFPDIGGISEEEKIIIVDKILGRLSETQRKNIDDYVNKKLAHRSKEYQKAATRLSRLKNLYINSVSLEIWKLEEMNGKIFNLNFSLNNYQNFYNFINILRVDYEINCDIEFEPFVLAFKTLEYNYRSLGFKKEEYQNWILDVSVKIAPDLSFQEFLASVINLAYYEIKYYQEMNNRGR